jgi:hypothetical protein
MAARRPPAGDFVYKETQSEADVNEQDSSPESETQESKSDEDQIDESDLKELDDKPIPYQRFKQVNEKGKALERQLEQIKAQSESQLKALTNQYEAKIAALQNLRTQDEDPYEYEDESTKQIRSLQSTIQSLQGEINGLKTTQHKQSVSTKLERLSQKYPEADTLAVQGWHQVLPEASLEELMAKSHEDNTKRVKTKLTEIIDRKKQKAKMAMPMGQPRIQLKESERPKTFRQATEMAKKWFPE